MKKTPPTPAELILPQIMDYFKTDDDARAYLEAIRWPDGRGGWGGVRPDSCGRPRACEGVGAIPARVEAELRAILGAPGQPRE